MLRRDFIKASSLALAGILIAHRVPAVFESAFQKTDSRSSRIIYHFHGHPRSGCASRPELAPLLEKGITTIPHA